MNPPFSWLGSKVLLAILIGLIVALLLGEREIFSRARLDWNEFEGRLTAENQTRAFVHSLEQYYVDFPKSAPPANDGELLVQLGGQNSKRIRYLKVERYARDSSGRCLAPKGRPYAVENQGREFRIWSESYPEVGVATGNRDEPEFPRFH